MPPLVHGSRSAFAIVSSAVAIRVSGTVYTYPVDKGTGVMMIGATVDRPRARIAGCDLRCSTQRLHEAVEDHLGSERLERDHETLAFDLEHAALSERLVLDLIAGAELALDNLRRRRWRRQRLGLGFGQRLGACGDGRCGSCGLCGRLQARN